MSDFSARIIWLTGLSGSGKSTIAEALRDALAGRGHIAVVLDGDRLRAGPCSDIGFTMSDRSRHVRRTGAFAAILLEQGVTVICALISPLRADRDLFRTSFPRGVFVEVFVDAPLEICARRDVKGLYARAFAGGLDDFTGYTQRYEYPLSPDIVLKTSEVGVSACVDILLSYLDCRVP